MAAAQTTGEPTCHTPADTLGDQPPAPTPDAASTDPTQQLLATAVDALGGSPRTGQQRMAHLVNHAATTGTHAVIQAGTGTGKSLAYLVAAIQAAHRSNKPVVISTATLALQNQLIRRDIPAVTAALGKALGKPLHAEVLKGRKHYLCLHKLHGGYPDEPAQQSLFDAPELPGKVVAATSATSRLGKDITRIRDWAETTDTGDRDDMPIPVNDLAWDQVSVSARECLGAGSCPAATECFVERSRARAKIAHLVVTNHAMLAIDAFDTRAILPEHDMLIVDEAHELTDRVTSAVTMQLSASLLRATGQRLDRTEASSDAFDTLADTVIGHLEFCDTGRFETGLPQPLIDALTALSAEAKEAHSRCVAATTDPDDVQAAAKLARASLVDIIDAADMLASTNEFNVIWAARDFSAANDSPAVLHVAPLWVSGLLADGLFGDRTVALTSATLAIGGDFDAVAATWGLPRRGASPGNAAPRRSATANPPTAEAPPANATGAHGATTADAGGVATPQHPAGAGGAEVDADTAEPKPLRWLGEDVGSPFDYPRQSILYLARHLPAPSRGGPAPAIADELAGLMTAAGGRTLGLFSSRTAAEEAATLMRDQTDLPILCQHEQPVPELIRRFAADHRVCLFGTLTLWQGVDVPGLSCALVTIDRIPFPRPDDPLAAARSAAIGARGGNGFMRVSAQHAALLLAQGAGRLIRSTTDQGVVAVLDSRLATARYGSYLTSALPPMWQTTNKQHVLGALTRLAEKADAAT